MNVNKRWKMRTVKEILSKWGSQLLESINTKHLFLQQGDNIWEQFFSCLHCSAGSSAHGQKIKQKNVNKKQITKNHAAHLQISPSAGSWSI